MCIPRFAFEKSNGLLSYTLHECAYMYVADYY